MFPGASSLILAAALAAVALLPAATRAADGAAAATSPPRVPEGEGRLLVAGQGAAEPALLTVRRVEPRDPDYQVFPARRRQAVVGFGGAFNEKGWEALQLLSPQDRSRVLRRLFAPGEGLSLNVCRIPIGATDYASSRYSLAETPGDLVMERFSIDRDRRALLPFVHAARALNPGMRFWGAAYSPPAWMKTGGDLDRGSMNDAQENYAAYALYLARFVEAYRAEGIRVEQVAVQNEPSVVASYPSCAWDPVQYVTFVRDHLGPTLARRNTGARVMLGTFNSPNDEEHVLAVLEDPAARSFVASVGLQWDALSVAFLARRAAPQIPIWHTEIDCGNHSWKPSFDPEKPPNDFAYAIDSWRNVRSYLDAGVEVYTLRNLVLDEQGKSIDTKVPWPQNAPVVVERATRRVVFTPMFHAMEQWGRYTGVGSVVLEGSGSSDALALARPDGTIAVQLVNPDADQRTVRIKVGDRAWDVALPARSFATLIVPGS